MLSLPLSSLTVDTFDRGVHEIFVWINAPRCVFPGAFSSRRGAPLPASPSVVCPAPARRTLQLTVRSGARSKISEGSPGSRSFRARRRLLAYLARCFSIRTRSGPLAMAFSPLFLARLRPFSDPRTLWARPWPRGFHAPELPAEDAECAQAMRRKRSILSPSSVSMVLAAPRTITRTLECRLP